MPSYIIYRVLNLATRKIYVGRTTTTLAKRWSVHKSHAKYWERYHRDKKGRSYLARSIAKYGAETFEIIEIDRATSFAHMVWLENFYIRYYNSTDSRYGYNLILDRYGEGREFTSEETKGKAALSNHRAKAPCGVSWDKKRGRWFIAFSHGGTSITDRCDDLTEAKRVWDRLALYTFGDEAILHYPNLRSEYLKENLEEFWSQMSKPKQSTSRYRGVKKIGDRWDARIRLPNGKRLFLGCYDTELLAAIAFDKVAVYLGEKTKSLNLPELHTNNYAAEGKIIYTERTNPHKRIRTQGGVTSRFRGVSRRSAHTWEMAIETNGERIRESYSVEELASYAFDYHVRLRGLNPNLLNHPEIIVKERPVPAPKGSKLTRIQRLAARVEQFQQLQRIKCPNPTP